MSDIIEILEAADVGSREIDTRIDLIINGQRFDDDFVPPYTTSIDAALTLVPDGGDWQMPFHEYNNKLFRCEIYGKGYVYVYGIAPTPALAICISAMKAIEND